MVNIKSDYLLTHLIDAGFMLLACGLAVYTRHPVLASLFGAKALLDLWIAISNYRRNKKMRFQLVEHLYSSDVETRDKQ